MTTLAVAEFTRIDQAQRQGFCRADAIASGFYTEFANECDLSMSRQAAGHTISPDSLQSSGNKLWAMVCFAT
jgi:hypothetical protein